MLIVRPIEAADEAAWQALWRGYLGFYESELPDEVFRTSFSRLIDPEITDYHGRLAVLEGRPVGLVHFIYHRHGWQIEDVCYLQDLYVEPEIRGTGAGRALIEAVYEAADANGTPKVYWLTQDFNTQARKLYDKVANLTPFIVYRR